MSASAMREIEWESCLLEPIPDAELEERFSRETGRPANIVRFLTGSPWFSDAMVRLSVQVNTHLGLDPDLADQAGLVVSQDNSCRFCFGMQRAFLRILGMPEEQISRLEQNLLVGNFSEREHAALDFARRLSRSQPLAGEADLERLRAVGFDDLDIAELAGQVAVHMFLNRVSTFAALPPGRIEEVPDAWWMLFVRPFMRMRLRAMRRRGERRLLTEAERGGPFSGIVNALDGLPLAADLRVIIDSLMESRSISERAAPLVFAVVARALGCQAAEREAASLLEERGLSATGVESILTHLSSSELSEAEALAVAFARETVWYQPARIQRRCQQIRYQLDRGQLLELLGSVSLANSICRLGVLTGSCE